MGPRIYPAPLVFWGSCPAGPRPLPRTPLGFAREGPFLGLSRLPLWDWSPAGLSPRRGQAWRNVRFCKGLGLPWPRPIPPPSDLSRTNGHSECIVEKTTTAGGTPLGPHTMDSLIKPWCGSRPRNCRREHHTPGVKQHHTD